MQYAYTVHTVTIVLPIVCCWQQLHYNRELTYQVGWSLHVSVLPDICDINLADFKFSSTTGLLAMFHFDSGVR